MLAGVDIELIDRANFAGRPPPQALESGPLGSPALGELAKGVRHDSRDGFDLAELETVAQI